VLNEILKALEFDIKWTSKEKNHLKQKKDEIRQKLNKEQFAVVEKWIKKRWNVA